MSVSIQVGEVGGNSSSRTAIPRGHQLLVVVVVVVGDGRAVLLTLQTLPPDLPTPAACKKNDEDY